MTNLGHIGDSSSLVYLFCELCNYGKTLVRQGHREGLPLDKPNIWVFCPLLKDQFPRDRKLIEECKNCSHFRGLSQDISNMHRSQTSTSTPYQITMIPARKRQPKKIFTKEEITQEEKEFKEREKDWEEEERAFGLLKKVRRKKYEM